MNRASRWFAILLCGIAIFGVDGAVRAAAPASAACVRTGSLGMLRAGLVQQVATAAPTTPVDPDYRKEIEQAQKIAQRIYDEGLEPGAKEYKRYAPGVGLIQDGNLTLVRHGTGGGPPPLPSAPPG